MVFNETCKNFSPQAGQSSLLALGVFSRDDEQQSDMLFTRGVKQAGGLPQLVAVTMAANTRFGKKSDYPRHMKAFRLIMNSKSINSVPKYRVKRILNYETAY